MRKVRSRGDYIEINRDRVVRKCAGGYLDSGESIRELAFLRIDVFWGEVVTALTAAILGRACKCEGGKREEDGESRETKNHVRWKRKS